MPTVRSPLTRTIEFDFTYRLTRIPKRMSRICAGVGDAFVTTLKASERGRGKSVVWRRTPPRTRTMSMP